MFVSVEEPTGQKTKTIFGKIGSGGYFSHNSHVYHKLVESLPSGCNAINLARGKPAAFDFNAEVEYALVTIVPGKQEE